MSYQHCDTHHIQQSLILDLTVCTLHVVLCWDEIFSLNFYSISAKRCQRFSVVASRQELFDAKNSFPAALEQVLMSLGNQFWESWFSQERPRFPTEPSSLFSVSSQLLTNFLTAHLLKPKYIKLWLKCVLLMVEGKTVLLWLEAFPCATLLRCLTSRKYCFPATYFK